MDALLVRPEVQRIRFTDGPTLLIDSGHGASATLTRGGFALVR